MKDSKYICTDNDGNVFISEASPVSVGRKIAEYSVYAAKAS